MRESYLQHVEGVQDAIVWDVKDTQGSNDHI